LRTVISAINPQATLVVISDSCFSGTVTRLAPLPATPRYMPGDNVPAGKRVSQRFLLPETGMSEILLTGCTDSEYSYDAEINGRYNGAMSAMALRVIKQNPAATYQEFYDSLRKLLPSSEYPQTPQLEGSDANKSRQLFAPLTVEPGPTPEPTPEPTPTPTPEPESPGCLAGVAQLISRIFKP